MSDPTGETVQIASDQGGSSFAAWRVGVVDARRGGLVLLHDTSGITVEFRTLARSYADHGYEVLIPRLFDRIHGGDSDPAEPGAVDRLDIIQAAVDALAAPVFVLGLGYGATLAWQAASRCTSLSAAAAFYGDQIIDHLDETPLVPMILHVGKADDLIPLADVETIRARYPDLPVHMYDAGHAFMSPSDFHADSARLSELRTLAHFARNGGGRSEA